jgi:adenylate cyclase
MSSDPEQEYFSDGMTDTLITDLSKLSGLFVIARNSTFVYKGKAIKPQQMSQELGVRYVVEGSVQKADTRVRITVQLVDATTGHHLWAERYDRELKDIFALQDEITQKVVSALKVKVTQEEQERFRRVPTDNLEAYDYYLRGLEAYAQHTWEANVQAQRLFKKAIELDPQYAEAYATLSSSYWREWVLQWSQAPQILEQAFGLARSAVALDDSLPSAHVALSWAYALKKQHEQALAEAQRALALDLNNAEVYVWLAGVFCLSGRPEEAIGLVEKAISLSPLVTTDYFFNLGYAYYLTGRYEDAIAVLLKSILDRTPASLSAHLVLSAVYSELSREEEARAEAAEVLRLNPQFSLEVWKQRVPYKDPVVLERHLTALRKAGLQ